MTIDERTLDEYYFLPYLRPAESHEVGEVWLNDISTSCGVSPIEFEIDDSFWAVSDPSVIDPSTGIPKGWETGAGLPEILTKVEFASEDLVLVTEYKSELTIEYKRTDGKITCDPGPLGSGG